MITSYNKFVNENIQDGVQTNANTLKINSIIDYTFIRKDVRKDDVKTIVEGAVLNKFYGICVNPEFVDYVVYELEDTDIKVISTLDFPDGKMTSQERISETISIISNGADEIDLSIDIDGFKKSYLIQDEEQKNADYLTLENEIKSVAEECHKNGVILKVIIESDILSFDELKDICHIMSKSNIDFVQTSSGMRSVNGDNLEKIKELRRLLPDFIKIKSSGGIRTIEQANKLYPYVDRIGTSVILK